MALLCAGALGNLIDRIWDKRVTDMFWFRAIDFPVFNVADVCITAAGVMLGVSVLGELFHRGRHEGQGPGAEGPEFQAPVAPEADEDKAGV
jgi:lipoprotein signal peptidase